MIEPYRTNPMKYCKPVDKEKGSYSFKEKNMAFRLFDYLKCYFSEVFSDLKTIVRSVIGIAVGNEAGEKAKTTIVTVIIIVLISALFLLVVFAFLSVLSGFHSDSFYDSRSNSVIGPIDIPDFMSGGFGQFMLALLICGLIALAVFDTRFLLIHYEISNGKAILYAVIFLIARIVLGLILTVLAALAAFVVLYLLLSAPVLAICLIFSPVYWLLTEHAFRFSLSNRFSNPIRDKALKVSVVIMAIPTVVVYFTLNLAPVFMYLHAK